MALATASTFLVSCWVFQKVGGAIVRQALLLAFLIQIKGFFTVHHLKGFFTVHHNHWKNRRVFCDRCVVTLSFQTVRLKFPHSLSLFPLRLSFVNFYFLSFIFIVLLRSFCKARKAVWAAAFCGSHFMFGSTSYGSHFVEVHLSIFQRCPQIPKG